jgi:hypothetical protein
VACNRDTPAAERAFAWIAVVAFDGMVGHRYLPIESGIDAHPLALAAPKSKTGDRSILVSLIKQADGIDPRLN